MRRSQLKRRPLSFSECLGMMRRRGRPELMEEGFFSLLPRAAEHVPELMRAFAEETDEGVRRWLLDLIGQAKSPQAMPLLYDQLRSKDEALRHWAIRGLKSMDTKESRTLLWQARSIQFDTREETAAFQRDLDTIKPFE